ncbi:MAG: ribonuclease J [Alphaproteobacteria bacterium]
MSQRRKDDDGLLFLPLGGSGEIGMNLNLYGLDDQWLIVDLGITFADDTATPGIDVIVPDITWIEERRDKLLGIVLTHAHEDHLGAVHYLWRRLRCPVYATPFTAAMLAGKLKEAGLADEVPVHVIPLGHRFELGPFDIELISITHSIPEPNALAIRTRVGTVLHTGDWKLDPSPVIGRTTEEDKLARLGDDGVLALVCDSTNVLSAGHSGSEGEVAVGLDEVIGKAKGRVFVTTFASHVARITTIANLARKHDRHLVMVGRSLWRVLGAARETGYLTEIGEVMEDREAGYLPDDKVLLLCTGSQGEPRGAMGRIAADDHPQVAIQPGDTVIFSSKIIPGNELSLAVLHNNLAALGADVITEKDAFVHVSGHPNRDELARMYQWTRPTIAVPVHGERRHLVAHAALARDLQVPHAFDPANGQIWRLAPEGPEMVGEVQAGRWAIEGPNLVQVRGELVRERRALMYNGGAVVSLAVDDDGDLIGDPQVVMLGIADEAVADELRDEVVDAVSNAVLKLPRKASGDDERVAETARIAARRVLRQYSGKRPLVQTSVLRV